MSDHDYHTPIRHVPIRRSEVLAVLVMLTLAFAFAIHHDPSVLTSASADQPTSPVPGYTPPPTPSSPAQVGTR